MFLLFRYISEQIPQNRLALTVSRSRVALHLKDLFQGASRPHVVGDGFGANHILGCM